MSRPLAIVFTSDFFACGIIHQGEVQLLEAEGFKLIPLYFEVRNGSNIYLVEKESFQLAPGPGFYGNLFELIDNNIDYTLYDISYPVVNLLTQSLDIIVQKYREMTGNGSSSPIPVILSFPDGVSSKVVDRIRNLLATRGFEIVRREHAPAVFLQNNAHALLLQCLGEGSIFLHRHTAESNIGYERIFTFDDKVIREELAKLVVQKALQGAYTNISEQEKATEYRKYIKSTTSWIRSLHKDEQISIPLTFPDGYPGTALVGKEELDRIALEAGRILNRVKQVQDHLAVQKIFLLGERLDNVPLRILLEQQFGREKLVWLTNDEKTVKEIMLAFLSRQATEQREKTGKEIQKLLREWLVAQGGMIKDEQQAQLEGMARSVNMPKEEFDRLVNVESEKIIFTNIEPIGEENATMLLKAQHRKHGAVVVKVLKTRFQNDGYEKKKLNDEFTALSQLVHPGVSKVLEINVPTDTPAYYIAEALPGEPLSKRLPFSDDATVARCALSILEALHYLHGRNMWYKTLNAGNIYIDPAAPADENGYPLKLVASGIEATPDLDKRKPQNIREFGLLLLQMLTGKTETSAIGQLTNRSWALIIQQTSGSMSANQYREIPQIVADVERILAEQKRKKLAEEEATEKATSSSWKWVIWLVVIALVATAMFFSKGYFNKLRGRALKPANPQELLFTRTYKGTLQDDNGRDVIYSLQILKSEQRGRKMFIEYTLRIDTIGAKNRYYEKNRQGEILLDKKIINLGGVLGEIEFFKDATSNRIVLKSRSNKDLELK